MSILTERLAARNAANVDKRKTELIDITVLDVIPATSTWNADKSVEYPRVRIEYKDAAGVISSAWIFTNNLVGGLQSYGNGVTAKARLAPNTYTKPDGTVVEDVQINSVKIEAITPQVAAMIAAMPKGAAMFSMAV